MHPGRVVSRTASAALVALVLLMVPSVPAQATAGDLDSSFSGDGVEVTTFDGYYGIAADTAVQPNGKIIAVGFMHTQEGIASDFALTRYTESGALDSSFGGTGKVLTDFGGGYDTGQAVVIHRHGTILAVGSSSDDMAVARYRRNGTLDPSFSSDGKVVLDLGGFETARDVAIDDAGRIVIAGTDGPDFVLVRLRPGGAFDTTFGGGDGIVKTDFAGFGDSAFAVAVQPDGRIVAAGFTVTVAGGQDFAVARYLADGRLDSSLGGDGLVSNDFFGWEDRITDLVVQSDGRIAVSGQISRDPGTADQNSDVAVARYRPNGDLDSSFGSGGAVTTDFGSFFDDANGMAVQDDGRIVVSAPFYASSNLTAAVARYETDGDLDATFSGDGVAVTQASTTSDDSGGLALQSDGKIVVATGTNAGQFPEGPVFGFLMLRFKAS
jgi:uncharacterized delta-60 repeat protein